MISGIRPGNSRTASDAVVAVRPDTFWGGLLCAIAAVWNIATLPWIEDRTGIIVVLAVLVGAVVEHRYPRVRVDAEGIALGGAYPFVPWDAVDRIERGTVFFRDPVAMSRLLVPSGSVRRARVTLLRTSAPFADAVERFAPDKLRR